jgi:CDP-4-dehydro-6-deoxyglucose reductase
MTVRIRILPGDRVFEAHPHETLLEAALRAGLTPYYSCSNGTCGECKARIREGRPGAVRFHDYALSAAEKADGTVLLCCAESGTDMVIEARLADHADDIAAQEVPARVATLEVLGADVMRLVVRTPRSRTLQFLAGQHVSLEFPGLAPRNKSIASCSGYAIDLEFHVRRTPGDPFAEHVFQRLAVGAPVTVRGPWGRFTFDEAAPRPVLFLAYETGLPPIKSLIEHGMRIGFPHPMHLYWAVHDLDGHYLEGFCHALVDSLDGFQYSPLVIAPEARGGEWSAAETAMLETVRRVLVDHPDIAGYEIYATGPARNMRAAAALLKARGLPEAQLHIDHLERFEAPRLFASAG